MPCDESRSYAQFINTRLELKKTMVINKKYMISELWEKPPEQKKLADRLCMMCWAGNL